MRSRNLLVAAVAAAVALAPAQAGADWVNGEDGHAGGSTDGQGGTVVVVVPGSNSPGWPGDGYQGGGGGGSSNIECKFFDVSVNTGAVLPSVGSHITDTSTLEEGTYIWLLCRDVTTGASTYENLFPWDPADPPVLTPPAAVLAQMAANTVRLPLPGVRTWPPAGSAGLVNLPVWLHVENWQPVSASASAGALTATVEATPVRAEWDMDEGVEVCSSAGSVYDPVAKPDPKSSSCSYTYRQSSGVRPDDTYHATVTVTWHLRWSATNGEGGDLGEVTGPPAGFDLQIEESQALVVPG